METTQGKAPRTAVGYDRFPLRTVAAMTGLTPDVIRAWERRYSAVTPVRGPRGARLYTREDIEHLRLLAQAVRHGRAIGDVAALDGTTLASMTGSTAAPADEAHGVLDPLVDAAHSLDLHTLEHRLGDALIAKGATRFAAEIASPLLRRVGDLWRRGELSIAAEHAVSAVLRNVIGALLRDRRPIGGPTVLLAAPRGEEHEFGLLFTALILVHNGCAVCHLGVNVPGEEIVRAADRMQANAVGIGLVNEENRASAALDVALVEAGLPAHTELWLGGRDATAVAGQVRNSRAVVLGRPEDIEHRARELKSTQVTSSLRQAV